MSDIVWTRDEGDPIYEAQSDRCVQNDRKINLSFSNKEGGFSGRLELEARHGPQETRGTWIWDGDEPREDSVDGEITELGKGRVVFEGSWCDKGETSPWDFFFDCTLTS